MFNLQAPFQDIDCALADRITQHLHSDDRLLWLTVALTSHALQQGHSCLSPSDAVTEQPYSDLANLGGEELPSPEQWLAHLSQFDLHPATQSPLVIDRGRIYLRRYWQFECGLADFFTARHAQQRTYTSTQRKRIGQELDRFFPHTDNETDWQKVAALNCLFDSAHIIIGGPGTGKTYTVTRILALLASIMDHPPVIKLAAPTGKAAQRLAESIRLAKNSLNLDLLVHQAIPEDAQTLHRLLGVIPNNIHFRHDHKNPIQADIVLVDEVSMVDLPMMHRLCQALSPDTQLILLGDADQLPSVATGSVLADLVIKPHPGYSPARHGQLKLLDAQLTLPVSETATDYVTELKFSRRFDDQSGIGQLAKRTIAGDATGGLDIFERFADVDWRPSSALSSQLQHWLQQFYDAIDQQKDVKTAFAQLKQFRILCATREGPHGTETINEWMRERLNKTRQPFYRGQPIMVTQNHYGVQLFNGDIGLVWPDEHGQLLAWFETESSPRAIALGRLPAVETVYAMTIHKTQGSEFNHVAMLLPDVRHTLATRELLYTGITRAKQSLVCVGEESVWRQSVAAKVSRWAGLSDRIR